MFIEQNKLKRQSHLLLQSALPDQQLLKALDENSKLIQLLEGERIQHKQKVTDFTLELWAHICAHVHTHTQMHRHVTHVCMCAHRHITYTRTHVTCMNIHVHTYMHVHTDTSHTHTHKHTHRHIIRTYTPQTHAHV